MGMFSFLCFFLLDSVHSAGSRRIPFSFVLFFGPANGRIAVHSPSKDAGRLYRGFEGPSDE